MSVIRLECGQLFHELSGSLNSEAGLIICPRKIVTLLVPACKVWGGNPDGKVVKDPWLKRTGLAHGGAVAAL